MIKTILVSLAALIVVFLIVAALQPGEFRVSRSVAVSAPAAVAYAQVNDLRKWQEISPYVKLDPTASYVFDGPQAGPGASLHWIGNSKIGEGRMTIAEARPDESVRMNLEFVKPFASTCVAEFTFKPEGDQTVVTWSMTGPKNFISKAMGLVVNMDKMIGGQFEEGLANLKRVSETGTKTAGLR
jgi:hypothetical protein